MANLLVISVLCILMGSTQLAHSTKSPPPEVFCLNTPEDLSLGQFNHDSPEPTLHHVKTSADLPGPLKGKLSGKDLFYFDGNQQETFWLVSVENWADGTPSPIYMYIKYYSYIEAEGGQEGTYVVPITDQHDTQRFSLPGTTGFQWREELIPLASRSSAAFQLYLNYFRPNDYFVIDKVILSKGYPISGKNDIFKLCGYTTEESVCQGDEYYQDPSACNQFHHCQYNEDGSVLADDVLTCSVDTVWCPKLNQCGYLVDCPCNL